MQEQQNTFFSHKQKNWLIGLLACTTVFTLVLNVVSTPRLHLARTFHLQGQFAKADTWSDFCDTLWQSGIDAFENDEHEKGEAFVEWYQLWDCDFAPGGHSYLAD